MRILHLSTPTGWRGGEQQVAHLINGLSGEVEKQFLMTPYQSELKKRMEYTVTCICYQRKGSINFSPARLIKKTCEEHKIDIIHAHDSHAHTAAFLAAVLFGNKTDIVLSRRVDFKISGNLFSNWKYNHPKIKSIIAVSEAIKNILLPVIREKEKIKVVYDGIDLSRYDVTVNKQELKAQCNLPSDKRLIGNLSALADHKDYPTFIRTANELLKRHSNIHFVVAGDGPLREEIINSVKAMELEQHITFLGFRKDVPPILKSLDVFLMTSKTEGLGSVLLEAFACGIPVVSTNAGGIPEIVKHHQTGLIASVGDEQELANQVDQLLSNAQLRNSLVNNATQFVKHFSIKATALQTKAVYQSLLEK